MSRPPIMTQPQYQPPSVLEFDNGASGANARVGGCGDGVVAGNVGANVAGVQGQRTAYGGYNDGNLVSGTGSSQDILGGFSSSQGQGGSVGIDGVKSHQSKSSYTPWSRQAEDHESTCCYGGNCCTEDHKAEQSCCGFETKGNSSAALGTADGADVSAGNTMGCCGFELCQCNIGFDDCMPQGKTECCGAGCSDCNCCNEIPGCFSSVANNVCGLFSSLGDCVKSAVKCCSEDELNSFMGCVAGLGS